MPLHVQEGILTFSENILLQCCIFEDTVIFKIITAMAIMQSILWIDNKLRHIPIATPAEGWFCFFAIPDVLK